MSTKQDRLRILDQGFPLGASDFFAEKHYGYRQEPETALVHNRNCKIIWAHIGISRRVEIQNLTVARDHVKAVLRKHLVAGKDVQLKKLGTVIRR